MGRGAQDMTWQERAHASFDNHVDGLFAVAQTPEFWQRTMGNAVEASAYAAAISATDQLLIHRDELVNGSHEQRKATLLSIFETSGLSAAGALPISIFMAIALTQQEKDAIRQIQGYLEQVPVSCLRRATLASPL